MHTPPRRHAASAGHQRGFTLVELMVTLLIATILLMLAIPSFTNQLRGWQRDSATKAFTAHVQLARSEAIKTSRRVVMCSSSNGTSCANSNEWRNGWLVFVDSNGNGSINNGETVIASRGASTGLTSMLSSGNVRQLVFMPNGLMASNATTLQVIPTGSIAIQMNEVAVNRIGRAYVRAIARES
ncbi:GspH/FimT family pseudopilin [Hydrogenophaga palleronii]|uniref:GspH/FimT family pseudopilin n=1 Tax=Hydrogenophaga palleronii TaxID=65655 RepID=UPI000AB3276D|nr:GspH/FimT family pseudopilin [Hydrogenophaga palleronii]